MNMIRIAALSLLTLATLALAQPLRLDVTRDTWVSCVGKESDANNGAAPKLKTKGVQEFFLIDIDPAPLRGRTITAATLHLHVASTDIQRRLSVSTLPADWTEGTGTSYATQKGSATFRFARHEEQPWAYPGSDITAIINGMGHSLWGFADATPPDRDGRQTIAVRPDVLAARAAGISYGFVVMDDVGSEYTRNGDQFTYHSFPNRFVHSREQNKKSAPYMMVTLGAADTQPPAKPESVAAVPAELPPGELIVTWTTPTDTGPAGTLGFLARYSTTDSLDWATATPIPQYLVPTAAAPGQPVRMHLRHLGLAPGQKIVLALRAIDRAGNIGPIAEARLTTSSAPASIDLPAASIAPFADAGPLPTLGDVQVAIVDALDKIHPLTGAFIPSRPAEYTRANHLWSAGQRTIRLHSARNEFIDFQFILNGPAKDLTATLTFDDPAIRPTLHRFRHVTTPAGPLPDPLIPIAGPISIPAADENLPGQKHASFLADIYIPSSTAVPSPTSPAGPSPSRPSTSP